MKARPELLVVALVLAGCASSRLPPLALRVEPTAYVDTLPVPEPGEQKERRAIRALLVTGPLQLAEPFDPGEGEALDLTHDDDVVGSAWWERRMGYRTISPEELARGPSEPNGAPASSGPLTVKSVKTTGVTPGFTMKDANGHTFIVKFDAPDQYHMQSAAGVIGNRLVWGAGYWVPEDYVAVFDADRLVVDPKATIADDNGERPLTMDDVHKLLARTRPLEGNRYLAFASQYVPGIPKGPFMFSGTRKDDPNDHFDHQHRRELRGLQVLMAWVNDTDIREGNTLDVFVKPGYLRHYLIDFGASLGSGSVRPKHPMDDVERPMDLYRFVARVASLGIYHSHWETEDDTADPAIGLFRDDGFNPGSWKANWSNQAFADMTDADGYWGAKIVAAYSDDHLRAAVATGALPSPDQEATLVRVLGIRRDRTVAYWFARVSTIEEPLVTREDGGSLRLSFRDLGIEQGVWSAGQTIYDWRFTDGARHLSGAGSAQPRTMREQMIDVTWKGTPQGGASDDLATLEIVTRRPGISPRPATISLRWDGQGYRVVGIAHGDPRR